MKCPFCAAIEDKVVDSRESREGDVIRRRRECLKCERRFTSYERIDEIHYMVVKKDGRREPFERDKIMSGVLKACEKRPIPMAKIDALVFFQAEDGIRYYKVTGVQTCALPI